MMISVRPPGDAMNKELRRHEWQSGSRGCADVSAADSSDRTPGRRPFLIGMGTLAIVMTGMLAFGGHSAAVAQSYPTAPVKLIVTTGAG
ncbi:MAG TPA: hypothetical protein VFJ46_03000, partial [Xanthobacteraceae bacterium]|nr:hypothetical protein [Xanthobacteraceae bacterium]